MTLLAGGTLLAYYFVLINSVAIQQSLFDSYVWLVTK